MSLDLDILFQHTPALLFVAGADGKLLRHSKSLAERFGLEGCARVEAYLAELADSEDSAARVLQLLEVNGTALEVRCVAHRAPDGSIHGQLEPIPEQVPDDPVARIEHALFQTIMKTLDIVLWAIDRDGKFLFQDGKALAAAGLQPNQFLGMNLFEIYPPDVAAPVLAALEGKASNYDSDAHGVHWQTWYVPLKNPAGQVDHVVGLSLDVSNTVRTKLELERRLVTIQEQQRAIHELSAPVINVWDKVLTVPLIGAMDNQRANELIERLLTAAGHSETRFVILDLTGVDALDTSIAGHLLRLLQSLRLLGVEGLVSGISPRVAQTMVGLGIDMESVRTFRSLRESLRYCMRAMISDKAAD
jgi:rsbT co-antagonist protein RsbR